MEDLCRFTFSSPQTYPLILALKTCLHRSFLSQQRYLDAILAGVKTCISRLKDNSLNRSGIQEGQDVPENDISPLQPQFDFLSFACDLLEAKVTGKAHADPLAIPDQVVEQPKKSGNVFKDAAQATDAKRAAARMSAQEEQKDGGEGEQESSPGRKPRVSEEEQRTLKDQVKSIGKKRTEAARKPQNSKVEEPVPDPAAKRGKSSTNDARKQKKLQ